MTTLMDALSPSAGPPPITAAAAESLSDEMIEERLAMLTQRLDAGKLYARFWLYGWLAVNGGGMIYASTRAVDDDGNDRVADIIDAAKGAIGVTYLLLQPLPGRNGADSIRDMPDATHADRAARLVRAEELAYAAAERAEQRNSWPVHIGNVALNAIGGAILLGLGDAGLAAQTFFIDAAVGELQIWSQPTQPILDWDDYQFLVRRTSPPPPPVAWRVAPRVNGVALQVTF